MRGFVWFSAFRLAALRRAVFRRACVTLQRRSGGWLLLVAALPLLLSCGKATHGAKTAAATRISDFESHRALYLAVDTIARAGTVARDLAPVAADSRTTAGTRAVATTAGATNSRSLEDGAFSKRLASGTANADNVPRSPVFQRNTDDGTDYDSRCTIYDGLKDDALWNALHREVLGHYVLHYRPARDHMYGLATPVIDVFDGVIEGTYTGRRVAPDGTRTPEGMNTEHSWPRSKGSRKDPAKSDLHHLFIVDATVNSHRQNFEFGAPECGGDGQPDCRWVSTHHGADEKPSRLGLNAAGEPVFEVRSARRGDVARAQMYFSVRYALPIPKETEAVLRRWHAEDPPDDFERERNRRIERVQYNRNPFVDCPGVVESIDRFVPRP